MHNVYEGSHYASEYAKLDWNGTYYLVVRDLPSILAEHVQGKMALDFGCGTGRSTRLLYSLGFEAVGVDIAETMIEHAKKCDPVGRYLLLSKRALEDCPNGPFDLILACFPFDNISNEDKPALLAALRRRLKPAGVLINIVSAERIYTGEWASFTTRAFPENRRARSGEVVRIVTTDFEGSPYCDDILCTDGDYRRFYETSGLAVEGAYRPLGTMADPMKWRDELETPPWIIYVLRVVR